MTIDQMIFDHVKLDQEWIGPTNIIQIPKWLNAELSPRKKRLIGCALCHRLAHLLRHKPAYVAIETAEKFAEGLADDKELRLAHNMARSSLLQCKPEWRASYYAGQSHEK